MGSCTVYLERLRQRHGTAITLLLCAALLFSSLFVNVGIARAALPADGSDADWLGGLAALGGCAIVCGGTFYAGGGGNYAFKIVSRSALGTQCVSCAVDILNRFQHYWQPQGDVSDGSGECWSVNVPRGGATLQCGLIH